MTSPSNLPQNLTVIACGGTYAKGGVPYWGKRNSAGAPAVMGRRSGTISLQPEPEGHRRRAETEVLLVLSPGDRGRNIHSALTDVRVGHDMTLDRESDDWVDPTTSGEVDFPHPSKMDPLIVGPRVWLPSNFAAGLHDLTVSTSVTGKSGRTRLIQHHPATVGESHHPSLDFNALLERLHDEGAFKGTEGEYVVIATGTPPYITEENPYLEHGDTVTSVVGNQRMSFDVDLGLGPIAARAM